ncbi:MAG: hypothetical protein KY392_06395, partial [Chloroflexi bacterium]|nr:hypothetical protein [Chloroflexota bacterium]
MTQRPERPVGRGRICVWLTSADARWNNWPAMRNFTPLVNETLYHLAATHTGGTENRRLEAGQAIVWTGKPGQAVTKAEITRP